MPPSSKYNTTRALFNVPDHYLQSTTSSSSKYQTTLFKVPHHPIESNKPLSSKYNTTLFKVTNHPLQCPAPPSLMYHTTLFKVPRLPLQSTTIPSSMYHTTLFKVPHRPLQSTTPPSSKYHTALFKVPLNPIQSTTPPSTNYHTALFNVPHHSLLSHHPLQSTTPPSLKYHATLFYWYITLLLFEYNSPIFVLLFHFIQEGRFVQIFLRVRFRPKLYWPPCLFKEIWRLSVCLVSLLIWNSNFDYSTTPPSSKYHAILFKVPHNLFQSTAPSSSKYHITLFKVPRHPKVPCHPLQNTTPPYSIHNHSIYYFTNLWFFQDFKFSMHCSPWRLRKWDTVVICSGLVFVSPGMPRS